MAAVTAPPPVPASVSEAPASPSVRIAQWRPWILEASRRFDVPQAWIEAVIAAESGGRTHLHGRPITSRAGAMGLMQLMPETYLDLARTHGLGLDPYEPRDNILAGTAYLSAMRARFGYPGLFGAYNAGPARFEAHLRTGAPLPAETQAYFAALARTPGSTNLPPAVLSGTLLFFRLNPTEAEGVPSAAAAPPGGLFAPVGTKAEMGDEGR
ncbi:lytic transglycosylase domain-containing protein [Caulobacter sp. FWC2]|uniref:lytic transglycosylase domain-containing protein n=1 Tax=Caulobacter sp. FWC2 TaxID=69664 RepID=UPI000C1605A4|nr:lytic transglycosylase domain-containing protein [Caulobacter sp. FWC2]PIB92728.1 lytic transglycosylase [Caulobacter sp. FWC2]